MLKPSVNTDLNDIRFGRCQNWVSTLGVDWTTTKRDTALVPLPLSAKKKIAKKQLFWPKNANFTILSQFLGNLLAIFRSGGVTPLSAKVVFAK